MSTDDGRAEYLRKQNEAERDVDLTTRWLDEGAPTELEMVAQIEQLRREAEGKVPAPPLTVEQAAQRLKVHQKTIRRRLPEWAAMTPPLAYRIGDGPRAPWRILPAALDVPAQTVAPEPAKPTRGRVAAKPVKRSATRWEA